MSFRNVKPITNCYTSFLSNSNPQPIEISSVSNVNIFCAVNWDLVLQTYPSHPRSSSLFLFENLYKQFLASMRP